MPSQPSTDLETFANPAAQPYFIDMVCPEFTCLCPKTGQPDFASIRIRYIPDKTCIELKSLKLYLWSFRNEGKFHEAVTHEIADKIRSLINPTYLRVVGDFYIRGGIYTVVRVSHGEVPKTLIHEPDPEMVQFGKIPGFGR